MEQGSAYLPHPVLPAHALQASHSQDNGTELLLLIQLPQSGVEVAPLWRDAKENRDPNSVPSAPQSLVPL